MVLLLLQYDLFFNSKQMYTTTTKEVKKIKILFQDLISNTQILSIKFFTWNTIIQVKKQLEKYIKTCHQNMRLFYKNIQLNKNAKRLLDYNIKNKQTLTVKMTPKLENSLGILIQYQIFQNVPKQLHDLFQNVKNGFLKGIKPKLTQNGTSGSYFLQNHLRKKVAIFKPFDQEPFAPNNPRNYIGQLGTIGFRRGILSGESATRQVAAYLLNDNFHGVPPTTYVQFYHPSFQQRQGQQQQIPLKCQIQYHLKDYRTSKTKHGSLQQFFPSDDVIGNFGSNIFSVQQIHKIAILDIRILNCDRNQENILVKKGTIPVQTSTGIKLKKDYKLIPIDHGLSFPDNFQIYDYEVIWMDYNQIQQPFTQKQLKFIDSINPKEDAIKLRQKLGFRQICLRNFRIAQTLLKKAANLGFTLNQIGRMLYRKQIDESENDQQQKIIKLNNYSQIQKLVRQAQNIYFFVKQNGIKSTIQYQIGLIKNRQSQQKKKYKLNLLQIKQKQKQDSEEESPKYHRNHHLHPLNNTNKQKLNKRSSVSLPTTRKKIQKEEKLKLSQKQQKSNLPNHIQKRNPQNLSPKHTQQQWQQIFFHYFEDILDRYLRQKKNKSIKRQRFRSQVIEQ